MVDSRARESWESRNRSREGHIWEEGFIPYIPVTQLLSTFWKAKRKRKRYKQATWLPISTSHPSSILVRWIMAFPPPASTPIPRMGPPPIFRGAPPFLMPQAQPGLLGPGVPVPMAPMTSGGTYVVSIRISMWRNVQTKQTRNLFSRVLHARP